jgi:hypothetical protein
MSRSHKFTTTAPKAGPYYMLFCREPDGSWHPQFGDYLRGTVMQEERDTYASSYAAADRRVRRLPDDSHGAVLLAQWMLNHSLLRNADGYQMTSSDILKAFGLPPNSPIPADHYDTQRIGDVAVTIVPRAAMGGYLREGGERLPKRRVVAQCPLCARMVCAGHLDQHMVHKSHHAILMDQALMDAAPISQRRISTDEWAENVLQAFPKGWDKAGGPTD